MDSIHEEINESNEVTVKITNLGLKESHPLLLPQERTKTIFSFERYAPFGAFLLLAVFVGFAIIHKTFSLTNLVNDGLTAPQPLTCLGPPYIYVTLHSGQNVLKYSRNGCLVDDNVLIMSEAYEKIANVEFRLALQLQTVPFSQLPVTHSF